MMSPRPALAAAAAAALLTGCATPQELYVDWIPVTNPAVACAGAPDCVRRATYQGKPLCTIFTADHGVSYARLGAQVRECLQ